MVANATDSVAEIWRLRSASSERRAFLSDSAMAISSSAFAERAGDLVAQRTEQVFEQRARTRRHDHLGRHAGLEVDARLLDVVRIERDLDGVIALSGLVVGQAVGGHRVHGAIQPGALDIV